MKIAFVSNFFNHHQSCISDRLFELTDGSYRFIATEALPPERKKLGYSENSAPYVLHYGDNDNLDIQIQEWIDAADVVIFGSAPEALLRNRKRDKKPIFRYSERPLKKGFQWWKYPLRWIRWHLNNPRKAPIYMLCASAYTAQDYRRFGLFQDRCFRWGYFPACKRYLNFKQILNQKDCSELLWCGRFLDWKHPDAALSIAHRLKEEGYRFRLNMIGTGEMEHTLRSLVKKWNLDDSVFFLGSTTPDNVRVYMEKAGIFLFTSDQKEGWGAVLNEAMNSGCAVIASSDAGSSPYLIESGTNGIVYESSDLNSLFERTKYLLDHPEYQKKLGYAAYSTIVNEWNPETAADRLMVIFKHILNSDNRLDCFESGPCSCA